MYIADQHLWLTSDKTRVVGSGDPDAAFLLAAPGHELDDETVARYGIAECDEQRVSDDESDENAEVDANVESAEDAATVASGELDDEPVAEPAEAVDKKAAPRRASSKRRVVSDMENKSA